MAIKLPDPGNGIPEQKTGNDEWTNMQIVRENFADQSNAASRLVGTESEQIPISKDIPSLLGTAATKDVGTAAGQVPLSKDIPSLLGTAAGKDVGAGNGQIPLVEQIKQLPSGAIIDSVVSKTAQENYRKGLVYGFGVGSSIGVPNVGNTPVSTLSYSSSITESTAYHTSASGRLILFGDRLLMQSVEYVNGNYQYKQVLTPYYSTANTTKDANGFIKAASPVVDLYNDTIEMNQDAIEQGGITFERLGTGDYLIRGSLGFAQEGWYIETPKDANGNVLVAVVYEQLENNDLSIKTYAKRFDDETGDIVANLAKPRDIPTGRFISLRLHELPKELPVMPMDEPTTEV